VSETKECATCLEVLPLDAEHWYWRTKGGKRYVNGARCRACVKAAQQQAPRSARTEAQRGRENATRQAKRADAGASRVPVPAVLRDGQPRDAWAAFEQAVRGLRA
jgi:hypothetical protein